MTIDQILDGVIEREAGFVDNPADRGGPTKFGITQDTLSQWLGRPAGIEEVVQLSATAAREIYRRRYVEGPRFDELQDPILMLITVDAGVHSGPPNGTRFLQRALDFPESEVDGVCGTRTITAANAVAFDMQRRIQLRADALAARVRFLGRLITNDLTDKDRDGIPDNVEMAAGWFNRLGGLMELVAA